MLDPRVCYQALRTRDDRFDGRLFVGVTSTGVYCRPVCPAGPPRFENCRFFVSAAAAQEAGFRPCLRCRPETAPQLAAWRGTSNTVSRGLALIADGELDGDQNSVDALAARLGVGGRQLRRLFRQHLGASPLTVAQTRRVLFAKQLIHDTQLPMGEIALAAGFGSVRRFNETFHQLYARPPTALRRKTVVPLAEGSVAASGVTVLLRYRPPYDWDAMLAHLRGRAIAGVEHADQVAYRRTITQDGGAGMQDGAAGSIVVTHRPAVESLSVTIRFPRVAALPGIITRVRRLFDLGADLVGIGAHLARDPLLAPLIAARPGLRVPGAWDGFELGVRAILGQQVSVQRARALAGQVVQLCGRAVPADGAGRGDDALAMVFPEPAALARADLSSLPMPGARRRALVTLAEAALADPLLFQPLGSIEETVARLRDIPGVGDWTAQYIALRAVREPDAFPVGDVGLLRAVGALQGAPCRVTALLTRAAGWRPWRAYAAQHLWTADALARPAMGGAPQ